jgi:hypothetical protein
MFLKTLFPDESQVHHVLRIRVTSEDPLFDGLLDSRIKYLRGSIENHYLEIFEKQKNFQIVESQMADRRDFACDHYSPYDINTRGSSDSTGGTIIKHSESSAHDPCSLFLNPEMGQSQDPMYLGYNLLQGVCPVLISKRNMEYLISMPYVHQTPFHQG